MTQATSGLPVPSLGDSQKSAEAGGDGGQCAPQMPQEGKNRELRRAARNGDLAGVEKWLAAGANAAAKDPETRGDALMFAVRHADASTAARLLPLCDPRASNAMGATPLMIAASWGSAECVRLLLPVSDARALNLTGCNAMMQAAAIAKDDGGGPECARILAAKCDPGARDDDGRTALMLAARQGAVKTALALLPISDAQAEGDDGDTALGLAMKNQRAACVEALKSATDPNKRNRQGVSLAQMVERLGDSGKEKDLPIVDLLSDWVSEAKQRAWVQSHGAESLPATAARLEGGELRQAMGALSEKQGGKAICGAGEAPKERRRRAPRAL